MELVLNWVFFFFLPQKKKTVTPGLLTSKQMEGQRAAYLMAPSGVLSLYSQREEGWAEPQRHAESLFPSGRLICSSVPATFSLGPFPSPPAQPIITNPPSHLSCHFHSAAKEPYVAKDCRLLTSLRPDGETEAHNRYVVLKLFSYTERLRLLPLWQIDIHPAPESCTQLSGGGGAAPVHTFTFHIFQRCHWRWYFHISISELL